ncbi:MAG TPA: hypothetical protein VN776_16460, partial [Terracidiphilus sp.]|nr:hypothetical protein [Terracidiphilus sp.]
QVVQCRHGPQIGSCRSGPSFRALTFLLPFAFAGRLDWWRGWLFVGSFLLEDGALRRELPGYEEYCTRTRYRLVPGVW